MLDQARRNSDWQHRENNDNSDLNSQSLESTRELIQWNRSDHSKFTTKAMLLNTSIWNTLHQIMKTSSSKFKMPNYQKPLRTRSICELLQIDLSPLQNPIDRTIYSVAKRMKQPDFTFFRTTRTSIKWSEKRSWSSKYILHIEKRKSCYHTQRRNRWTKITTAVSS